jgi:CRISPR-associated protein Cmr4
MKSNNAWLITAKSNLHVGNENTLNFGLIDKAVQRDVLTGLPCINSSSLKGAINEYCSVKTRLTADERIKIFGVDKTNKKSDTQKGLYTFFDANILFLPVQGKNELYYLVTTESILKNYVDKMQLFNVKVEPDISKLLDSFKQLQSQSKIELISDCEFKERCSDEELPIIARNCLEDGRSVNLWYEQVIPSETVFYTLILSEVDELSNVLNNEIVQIGANATIGYGYCRLTKIEDES